MKSRKTINGKTAAQILFAERKLLLERPENMTYEEYRFLRKYQGKVLDLTLAKAPNLKIQQQMGLRQGYNFHPRIVKLPTENGDKKE